MASADIIDEQAMDGTQSADSSDEVSEMETVSKVLMHCMHLNV